MQITYPALLNFLLLLKTGFLFGFGWPGNHFVEPAGFKLRLACLCLPSAGIKVTSTAASTVPCMHTVTEDNLRCLSSTVNWLFETGILTGLPIRLGWMDSQWASGTCLSLYLSSAGITTVYQFCFCFYMGVRDQNQVFKSMLPTELSPQCFHCTSQGIRKCLTLERVPKYKY